MADETIALRTEGCPQCKKSREETIPFLKDRLALVTEERDQLSRLVDKLNSLIVFKELQKFEAEKRRSQ